MNIEIWKDVVGYEGLYEVSTYGNVRTNVNKVTYTKLHGERKWKQRVLKQKISKKDNCHKVDLWLNGKEKTHLVHRLVAYAFLDKPENKDYINHIDGDRHNNNLINLEWCDHTENNNHAFDKGLIKTGKKVKITNLETNEQLEFRSLSKASLYLGFNVGFLSNRIKNNNLKLEGYSLEFI